MIHFLYSVFIFPIEQILDLAFMFVYRIFNDAAYSILGISLAVSVLTLPLNFIAEKYQKNERDIIQKLKPKIDSIKSVFKGDKQYMVLSAYYRQNNYHPIYALRSSLGLIFQIPFFIAAFHFLSNLELIIGIPFGPIRDISKPDSLLTINSITVNILPVIMTFISFASALVYSKGQPVRDKFRLYGISLLFLVLLYNSPSGMVLYWTANNLFSLGKNIITKTKFSKHITLTLVSVSSILISIYLLFFHLRGFQKRVALTVIFMSISIGMYIVFFRFDKIRQWLNKDKTKWLNEKYTGIFSLSIIIMFLLAGLVIPSMLIESSVSEFSFIDNYSSPFPFIFNTLLHSFGFFILWPLCIFMMVSRNTKRILAMISVPLAVIFTINVFLFPGYYGFLTIMFRFSESIVSDLQNILLNWAVILAALVLVIVLIKYFRKILMPLLSITTGAFIMMGAIYCIRINNTFNSLQLQLQYEREHAGDKSSVFHFSQNGRNVVVIMLDRAVGGFVPFIFEEKPELHESFDGFTLYENTIAFSAHTIFSSPSLYGGYEYTPLEMNKRSTVPLVDDHNDALKLLPVIFHDNGFNVTVTDPPYANYLSRTISDLSIFHDYPQIHTENIIGKYTSQWLEAHPHLVTADIPGLIEFNMIRFSLLRFIPLMFRPFVYDEGKWLSVARDRFRLAPASTVNNYSTMDLLPDITAINDSHVGSYNSLVSLLTHSPTILQVPEYILSNDTTNRGTGRFAGDENYHVNMAAMLLLGKWFDFLKENGVYDNTRIIVVSDHGLRSQNNILGLITIPNRNNLQYYNSVLMVKDFNAHGNLTVDNSFMTIADVPVIVLDGVIENPVNPWSGKPIEADKENGVIITSSRLWKLGDHGRYTFNISSNDWLHVHTNIFDADNWSRVNIDN